jgi:protein tyrosine/serine phosphatase
MLDRIWGRVEKVESKLRNRFGNSIETPWQRFLSHVHFQLMDHGLLRILWTNFYQFSPNAFRSNQPSPKRLKKYKKLGIKTIINLRGTPKQSHYLFEQEACDELGLALINCSIFARAFTSKKYFIELFDSFDKLELPFVLHCKSGADRASIAAAFYQIYIHGYSVKQTRDQFSIKYLHLKFTKTGVLDFLMDTYEREGELKGIELRDWITNHYDAESLQKQFLAKS